MLTLRSGAALLSAADGLDALANVAAAIGFTAEPLALDAATLERLTIPAGLPAAAVIRGPGSTRALLVESPAGGPLRDTVQRLAARLTARAPHLAWLLLAAERNGPALAIATWAVDRRPPRVAALIVDRRRVVDSDAETVRALASVPPDGDALAHERWLDILGRDSLTRRFYRALEAQVARMAHEATGRASREDRRELALLCVSRLLFLSFLEAKGWLDGDHGFLLRAFERGAGSRGGFHRGILDALFFGTLNTPLRSRAPAARAFGRVPFLNGGLFARTPVERRAPGVHFPDDALGALFGDLLCRYRFTAREDASSWSEAAVDPEMLGRAFESLMAAGERKASGAFYTPQPLVEHVTAQSLAAALERPGAAPRDAVQAALRGEAVPAAVRRTLLDQARRLRVLDPACGSGAFLVHVLERLAALRLSLGEPGSVAGVRREALTRSIFGVDVNPTAVWLCELRLWLSVVIESGEADPLQVPALPNLDRNVRVGDSLLGGAFDAGADAAAGRRLAALRERYARASGPRKAALLARVSAAERASAVADLDARIARLAGRRREAVLVARARDLFGERASRDDDASRRMRELREENRRLRDRRRAVRQGAALPFTFAAHFADVAAEGGFDLVIGNPPWVRPHHVPAAMRAALRREFSVARDAGWAAGEAAPGTAHGFGAQVDLAALFAERAAALARQGGAVALLVPAKLWRSLAGGGVRRLLHEACDLLALEDWSEAPVLFDAAVYPSILVARRLQRPHARLALDGDHPSPATRPSGPACAVAVHGRRAAARWTCDPRDLAFDPSPGSPWLLMPAGARAAFDRLTRAGRPLAATAFGAPRLGVKCGANEAFVVEPLDGGGPLAAVRAGAGAARRDGRIERGMLRPLVRGETVLPWRARSDAALLWTHGEDGAPLASLPPLALHWLSPWRARLAARSDARGATAWWSLFRTDAAACDRPRVVWPDVGRTPRAAVIPAGDARVPLNSCYVARAPSLDDAHALAALLNGPVAAAWLAALAEPARGGYHRYLGWTLALLPLPRDWAAAVRLLAPLGERGARGDLPSRDALLDRALEAYDLRDADVAALLEWCG